MDARSLPQETVDFAHKIFDAARNGETELLRSAVDRGLPPNLTNDQGMYAALRVLLKGVSSDYEARQHTSDARCLRGTLRDRQDAA